MIGVQPEILFDNRMHRVREPDQMLIGDLFFLRQDEPLARGETILNPFDVGPGMLDAPDITGGGVEEADLLLVRLTEIKDDFGIIRVEAHIDDSERVLEKLQTKTEGISSFDFGIGIHRNELSEEDVRGSLNHLIKDR